MRSGTRDAGIIFYVYSKGPYHRFLPLLHKGGTAIDIGANVGAFTVLAAQQSEKVHVVSYEPCPNNFMQLRENVRLNGLQQRVLINSHAVAGHNERRRLVVSPGTLDHSLHDYGQKRVHELSVETVSLESVFESAQISKCEYLKLDCEGAEYEILYSAPKSVFQKIESITMEFHGGGVWGSPKELQQFLQERGFDVVFAGTTLGMLWAVKRRGE